MTPFFISGLPRSGSTLLSSILSQNPEMASGVSSPLASMVHASLAAIQAFPGGSTFDVKTRKLAIKGLMDGFMSSHGKRYIFDTSRSWTTLLPLLRELYPNTKVVVCVRNVIQTLDSFERLFARAPLHMPTMFSPDEARSVYSRVESMMAPTGIIGRAYNGIREAFYGNNSDMLVFIEYDDLCANPQHVMAALYRNLNIPHFSHDFDNVAASHEKYDADVGIPNIHTVRKSVGKISSNICLPPDVVARFSGGEFWRRQ